MNTPTIVLLLLVLESEPFDLWLEFEELMIIVPLLLAAEIRRMLPHF
jgi:hypothetical protein